VGLAIIALQFGEAGRLRHHDQGQQVFACHVPPIAPHDPPVKRY
jgi:hypothetical protein